MRTLINRIPYELDVAGPRRANAEHYNESIRCQFNKHQYKIWGEWRMPSLLPRQTCRNCVHMGSNLQCVKIQRHHTVLLIEIAGMLFFPQEQMRFV